MSTERTRHIRAFTDEDGKFIVYNKVTRQYHYHSRGCNTRILIRSVKDNNAATNMPMWLTKHKPITTTILG